MLDKEILEELKTITVLLGYAVVSIRIGVTLVGGMLALMGLQMAVG